MNILMIAPEQIPLPPLASGSVETCMYQIAKQLAKKHKVTIISRRHPQHPNLSRMGNLIILRVPAGSPQRYIATVMNHVKNNHYDWIQVDNRPMFVPVVKKYFPKTPVSLFLHSLTFVTPPKTSVKAAARHMSKADLIIGNSRSLKAQLTQRFPQHHRKMKYVWLGVDTRQFRLPTPAQRIRVRVKKRVNRAFTIVFVGRLIPLKGLPVLIKAVSIVQKSIPRVHLVIAGGGRKKSYVRYLRKLTSSLHVPSSFLGNVSRKKMHEVYWLADCSVCPSQGHEAFGLVAVEAMASGVACIASNNGGLREVIKHNRSGVLVKHYRNPRAFTKAMLRVWKHKQRYRKLGIHARSYAIRQFSWRSTAAKLEQLYRRRLT
jgi:spore coat protein SA